MAPVSITAWFSGVDEGGRGNCFLLFSIVKFLTIVFNVENSPVCQWRGLFLVLPPMVF